MKNTEQPKKKNKFVSALKRIFVHNIGWKIFAVVSAAALCFIAAGLTGL